MAALTMFKQNYVDLPDGKMFGLHVVTLQSASDTITVPDLANTTSGASVKHMRRQGQAALTVTNSGNTVTIAGGTKGDQAVIVSFHEGRLNVADES